MVEEADTPQPVQVVSPNDDAHRSGVAAIKPEFLLKTVASEGGDSAEVRAEDDQKEVDVRDNRRPRGSRGGKGVRGQDKKRELKMAHAMSEVRANSVRLCPSILIPGRECRFGEKCNALHSIPEYLEKKPEDLGDTCVIYDQLGACNFGVSCRFARAHTDFDDNYRQLTKAPNPLHQPTLNSDAVPLQIKMRKHQYDFGLSDRVAAEVTKQKPDENGLIGCMEREKLKLNMRDLKGKRYLAPLTTVGNLPFRRLCVQMGAEVTCGEMAVATSLLQGNPSEWSLVKRHPSEKCFGVQLVGGYPDTMTKAAQILTENMDVDFLDVNLGCPIDAVNDKGGGCALFNRSNKLCQVVSGMQSVMGETPLSVKMRYGLKEGEHVAHHVMKRLVATCPPQLITLHPRSKEQRYTKSAEWEYVPACAQALNEKVPLWVSGDLFAFEDFYAHLQRDPVDGVMVGRGALVKPWLFTEIAERRHWDISATERLDLVRQFANFGLEHWGSDEAGVQVTRRFLLEWLSFHHRYIPIGLLERLPVRINDKPPPFVGRSDLETLLGSRASSDWLKVTEMFLGPPPANYLFVPKHKANAY